MKQERQSLSTSPQSAPQATELEQSFSQVLAEPDAVRLSRLLKAVADPTRLQLLLLIKVYGGLISVHEIVAQFRLQQPTISHHLHILRAARLIACTKKGLWSYYYIRTDTLESMAHMHQLHDLLAMLFLDPQKDQEQNG